MNVLHLKYAVEIANTGSINKAAEVLYMGQPNLSRAIKDLEGLPYENPFLTELLKYLVYREN